jgi:hypothetical protein
MTSFFSAGFSRSAVTECKNNNVGVVTYRGSTSQPLAETPPLMLRPWQFWEIASQKINHWSSSRWNRYVIESLPNLSEGEPMELEPGKVAEMGKPRLGLIVHSYPCCVKLYPTNP